MKKPVKISQAEWEVMNVVWQKWPSAASEIVHQLSAKNDWHSRTIRTLLDRLVKKGALTTEADGKAIVSENEAEPPAGGHVRSYLDAAAPMSWP